MVQPEWSIRFHSASCALASHSNARPTRTRAPDSNARPTRTRARLDPLVFEGSLGHKVGTTLVSTTLVGTTLVGTTLVGITLVGITLVGTTLVGTTLVGTPAACELDRFKRPVSDRFGLGRFGLSPFWTLTVSCRFARTVPFA